MMDSLKISGKSYISSSRAAKEHGYHSDYIGQLIRSGKVQGKKVGRAWYVSEDSLAAYLGKEGKGGTDTMPEASEPATISPDEIEAGEPAFEVEEVTHDAAAEEETAPEPEGEKIEEPIETTVEEVAPIRAERKGFPTHEAYVAPARSSATISRSETEADKPEPVREEPRAPMPSARAELKIEPKTFQRPAPVFEHKLLNYLGDDAPPVPAPRRAEPPKVQPSEVHAPVREEPAEKEEHIAIHVMPAVERAHALDEQRLAAQRTTPARSSAPRRGASAAGIVFVLLLGAASFAGALWASLAHPAIMSVSL